MHAATKTSCGVDLEGSYGYITSINFPHSYENGLDCSWHISVRNTTSKIQLRFKTFELEERVGTDYLMVFDGPTDQHKLIDRYNGHISEGFRITSTSNHMYLVFHSDKSTTKRGFNITYQTFGKILI